MSRSDITRWITLVFLGVGSLVFAAEPTQPVRAPNVLLLFADDLGAKELPSYGHPSHRTPALDSLAREGTLFRTCWATPLCTPSRVMLMTGRYACHTGWYAMFGNPLSPLAGTPKHDLGRLETTFADLAKSRGYATALAGKWQLPGEGESLIHDCGFDHYLMWAYKYNLPAGVTHVGGWENKAKQKTSRYWHPCLMQDGRYVPTKATDYGPDLMTDFLIQFIKEQGESPWLAYYPMCLTHPPLVPTPDVDHPGQKKPGNLASNLEYLDHLVGRLLKAIEEPGLRENTWVIFVGDNGTARQGKGTVTELGVRVPFIVRGPGVQAGVVSDELVSISDIFPTIAEAIGASLPTDRPIDGISLTSTLRGSTEPHREWVFSYLGVRRMIRDRRWLLEGDGKLYDCGDSRVPGTYRLVEDENNTEAKDARSRFAKILSDLPTPDATGEEKPSRREKKRSPALDSADE